MSGLFLYFASEIHINGFPVNNGIGTYHAFNRWIHIHPRHVLRRMKLTKIVSSISSFSQDFIKSRVVATACFSISVRTYCCSLGLAPGEYGGSCRYTNRTRGYCLAKIYSFACLLIQVWCDHIRISGISDDIPCLLVRHNFQDVWRRRFLGIGSYSN